MNSALCATQFKRKNNLMAYKLAEEFVKLTHQDALMLKVDFQKAYDRVEHCFLWETMLAMGFNVRIITFIQGLIMYGNSKVHFNGLFTPEIALERGVRQGCPLAPLLYAISTQPLMIILDELVSTRKLQGIK